LGASLGGAAARALGGEPVVAEVDRIGEHADSVGVPWLAALARAIGLADRDGPRDLRAAGLPKDDPWGSALCRFFAGVGALRRQPSAPSPSSAGGEPVEGVDAAFVLAEAVEGFRDLDAPVLAAWSSVAHAVALVRRGDRGAGIAVRRATQAAAKLGVDASCLFVGVGVGVGDVASMAPAPAASSSAASEAVPRLRVRCFGPFSLWVDDVAIDLSAIKPRVRSLVRLLALQGGRPLHRERIIECLWPDEADVKVGTRNLQVAISSLRQLVEPGVARGEATLVRRDGDAYRLVFDGDVDGASDLMTFRRAVDGARTARSSGDVDGAVASCQVALDAYTGELLADEGPAEWVATERDGCRLTAADVALWLAELTLARGDLAASVDAAERGLRIDAYRDGLWRALIAAYDAAGDRAASRRAAARYREVLDDLGV
jgi:DNA-binding SARP family transcriptional activator